MLNPAECGAPPTVAYPDRGLISLTIPPTIWQKRRCPTFLEMIESYSQQAYLQKAKSRLAVGLPSDRKQKEPHLPSDPRQWSREDVAKWIQYVTTTHRLPTVQLDRFLMNGKALCLMTMDMFVSRVPLGGKLLYKDFQLRLNRALYS
ncbi:ets DNA-binding protein pokkuri-like isoform X2 [Stegodyphus dumicola]|nr:ets DNA-binding protein pokkuri-like isoform X2 [Stegodyphus dumicola]